MLEPPVTTGYEKPENEARGEGAEHDVEVEQGRHHDEADEQHHDGANGDLGVRVPVSLEESGKVHAVFPDALGNQRGCDGDQCECGENRESHPGLAR